MNISITFIIKDRLKKAFKISVCYSLSLVQIFATRWTVVHQVLLSVEFSRQEYWSGVPFPSPGNLPDPGIQPRSPALQADSLLSEPPGKPQNIRKDMEFKMQ